MKKWRWIGALVWLAVVAGAASIAWFAIDQAGRAVTDSDSGKSVLGPGSLATLLPITPASTTPAPSRTPHSTPSRTPGRPSTPTPASPTAPATERLWTGTAGTVSASCNGTALRLLGASPADGWRVDRDSPATVLFERASTEVRVRMWCSAGVPVFYASVTNAGTDGAERGDG